MIFLNSIKKSALSLLFILSFFAKTEAGWQPPVQVSTNLEDPSSLDGPDLSVNPTGNAISVWTDKELSTQDATIRSSFYLRSTNTWEAPATISSLALNPYGKFAYTFQGDVDISLNGLNYAVSVWKAFEFRQISGIDYDNGVVVAAARDSNGVWAPAQTISEFFLTEDVISKDASVSVNDSGLAVAAWTQNNITTGVGHTMVSFLSQGGSWSTPVAVSGNEFTRNEGGPSVAIDPKGNVIVAWRSDRQDLPGSQYDVVAATYNASSSSWSGPVILESAIELQALPKVAIDYQGNAMVIWPSAVPFGAESFTKAAYYRFVSGWEAAQILFFKPNQSVFNPYIVLDPAGNATAYWSTNFEQGQIYAARRPIGQNWQTAIRISQGDFNLIDVGNMQNPLAVDPEGNVIAIWKHTFDIIEAAIFLSANNAWQMPEVVFSKNNQGALNAGIASCGFAIALWEDSSGIRNVVLAAINENFLLPQNLFLTKCCEKFATQKVCLTVLNWTPNPCFLSYRIYRDGILIGEVSNKGPFKFIDPLNRRTRNAIYTLTGINSSGAESNPIPAVESSRGCGSR